MHLDRIATGTSYISSVLGIKRKFDALLTDGAKGHPGDKGNGGERDGVKIIGGDRDRGGAQVVGIDGHQRTCVRLRSPHESGSDDSPGNGHPSVSTSLYRANVNDGGSTDVNRAGGSGGEHGVDGVRCVDGGCWNDRGRIGVV